MVESASAAERLGAARAFVESFLPGTEVLIVGASRAAADDLAREVTVARGVTFGLHRLSLLQLAARFAVAEMSRLGRAPITTLGAEALAARVSFEATRDGALAHFAAVAGFPGFAPALAATIDELRQAGATPAMLGGTGVSTRDVAELLRRFEEQLAAAGLVDRAELLRLAARGAEGGEVDAMRRMPMVLLDPAIESRVEREFVAAVTAITPALLITVPAGDEPTAAAARELVDRRRRADDGAAALDAVRAGAAVAGGTDLARLRAYLFSEEPPPEAKPEGDVLFFSAPGEGREVVEIARLILDEARRGTPFDRMAVLLRAPGTYWSLLEAALARAGIPAFFTRGTRRPDVAGRAFLALIDCAREGLSAKRFAEYLSLAQVPPLDAGRPPAGRAPWVAPDDEMLTPSALATDEESPAEEPAMERPDSDAEPVVAGDLRAPWRWEELLVESAVIGGRERWARRLAGLEAQLRLKQEALVRDEPESPRALAVGRDIANLDHLRRFALPVIDRLASLRGAADWGEWIPALSELAPLVLKRPERVLAVLAELRPLAPVGPVSLDEVRDVLVERLASLARRPPASRHGRIFVGAVAEARGRAFDAVFLPGLAERVFPEKPREDPILLDALREHLDADLARQHDRSQRERLLLRLAAGAATRRLYLSYSRIDLTVARSRVPSFYALEVRRALTGHIPDPQTLQVEADEAARARLAWPAPKDARRSIDEEEHDLAVLDDLLRVPADEARGRARYLLELSPALARSLRSRWARWRVARWMPQDGLVRVTDGTRDALAASSLRARAYSVSALQKFAACPYQFYLSAICRLEPRTEIAPLERLDPATRGKMFHRVQAETMRTLQQEGRLPLEPAGLARAIDVLDATFTRVVAETREELAPAIERVWQTETESMRVDLRVWLEKSVDLQREWEPLAFELAFGLPPQPDFDARSTRAEVTVGEFRLRGIVDLVEGGRGEGGRNARGALRVTDYKTGGNYSRWRMVVGGGETLQPVLYPLAVESVLGQRVVAGRLFYCTRDGGFTERVVDIDPTARTIAADVLGTIDDAIVRGFLPAAPRPRAGGRPGACGICDFIEVCGREEELRSQDKERTSLGRLLELRDRP